MVLICARIAPERGRRTTGRQGVDVRTCSVEPLTPEAWRDLSASDDETSVPVATNGAGKCADSHCPLVCLLLRRRTGIGPTRRCIPVLLHELGSLLFAVPQRALLHDLS